MPDDQEIRVAQFKGVEFGSNQHGNTAAIKVFWHGKTATWRCFHEPTIKAVKQAMLEDELATDQWREWKVKLVPGEKTTFPNVIGMGEVKEGPDDEAAPSGGRQRQQRGGWQPRSPHETESIERQSAIGKAVEATAAFFQRSDVEPDFTVFIDHVEQAAERFASFIHARVWSESDD